jgi:putative ABC transport system ATP-binding protein
MPVDAPVAAPPTPARPLPPLPPPDAALNAAPRSTAVAPVLDLVDVGFRWPGAAAEVLDLPALRLAAGETLFVRGPSGGGKSTLLSLCAGVQLAQRGRVSLLGQDWAALPAGRRDRHRAAHIGYVFQQFNLLPYLSVLDNVLLPCRLSAVRGARAGATAAAQRVAAQGWLARMGLGEALWRREAAQLSVGQQQRVAAARALIGAPELVIADEPTSALDEARRTGFMAVLLEACRAAGSALLFVSHDLRLAEAFDREVDLSALNRAAVDAGAEAAP